MKKKLLVSIYDGIYGNASAVELRNNEIVKVIELSKNKIRWLDTASTYLSTLSSVDKAKLVRFIKAYESIIICNNGSIKEILLGEEELEVNAFEVALLIKE